MTPTVDALTEICRIVTAVCKVRLLPREKLGAICAALRDNDGDMLAECLIGAVPFDAMPAGEMERLSE